MELLIPQYLYWVLFNFWYTTIVVICINGVILIVFDASTLILLAKIDLLRSVLCQYGGVIPELVKEEIIYKNAIDTKLIVQQIKEGNLIGKSVV